MSYVYGSDVSSQLLSQHQNQHHAFFPGAILQAMIVNGL